MKDSLVAAIRAWAGASKKRKPSFWFGKEVRFLENIAHPTVPNFLEQGRVIT